MIPLIISSATWPSPQARATRTEPKHNDSKPNETQKTGAAAVKLLSHSEKATYSVSILRNPSNNA